MFKYHAPSTPAVAGPGLDVTSGTSGRSRPGSVARARESAGAFLRRASSPPAPRPRIVWFDEEDDEDLQLPQVFKDPVGRPEQTALTDTFLQTVGRKIASLRTADWSRRRIMMAGTSALLALGLLTGGALTLFGPQGPAKGDRAVKVETISLNPAYEAANASFPVKAAEHAQGPIIDDGSFKARFEAADTGGSANSALQQKIQDRIEQDVLKPASAVIPANFDPLRSAGTTSDTVLGYAPTRNPHANSTAGLAAIARATAPRAEAPKRADVAEQLMASNESSQATPESSPVTNSSFETAKVTQDVNFRSAEDKNAEILGVIAKDTKVSVGSCDKWWCSVVFNGQSGFVGRKFVEGKG